MEYYYFGNQLNKFEKNFMLNCGIFFNEKKYFYSRIDTAFFPLTKNFTKTVKEVTSMVQ